MLRKQVTISNRYQRRPLASVCHIGSTEITNYLMTAGSGECSSFSNLCCKPGRWLMKNSMAMRRNKIHLLDLLFFHELFNLDTEIFSIFSMYPCICFSRSSKDGI